MATPRIKVTAETTIIMTLMMDDKKVKLSLYQAVETHRVVRRRGSHIF
jgi:hypothetical protein